MNCCSAATPGASSRSPTAAPLHTQRDANDFPLGGATGRRPRTKRTIPSCNSTSMRIIRGKYGRRRFDVPSNITARPTTDFARENIFNVFENLSTSTTATPSTSSRRHRRRELRTPPLPRMPHSNRSGKSAGTAEIHSQSGRRTRRAGNFRLIRGDAMRYIASAPASFDFVFADPPYDMEGFAGIPSAILSSGLLRPGALFTIEHSARHDFSTLPHFLEHRAYGSVNFSIFRIRKTTKTPEPMQKLLRHLLLASIAALLLRNRRRFQRRHHQRERAAPARQPHARTRGRPRRGCRHLAALSHRLPPPRLWRRPHQLAGQTAPHR